MKLTVFLSLILTLFFSADLYAQDKEVIQEKILFYLSETKRLKYSLDDYDSLDWTNAQLMSYLRDISKNPATLQYSFDDMALQGMNIVTSEDKKLRIYSWDTETGGTMRFFNELIQYRTSNGAESYVLNDVNIRDAEEQPNNGESFIKLYQIQTKNQSSIYLGFYVSIGSTRDIVKGVKVFTIDDNRLNDSIRVFQKANEQLNNVSYYFDYHLSRNRSGKLKNDIYLSKEKQELYVPVVNEDYAITNKSLVYKFNGKKFVYDKTAY